MRGLFIAAGLGLGFAWGADARQPAEAGTFIHVVLFVPADRNPPAGAAERIAQAAEYSERFFIEWMKYWKYPPAVDRIFERDDDGRVRVLVVKGKERADSKGYNDSTLLKELWPAAHEAYELPDNRPLWWVWVYKGDPPTRFSNYRGSGDLNRGGWAVVNYDSRPGRLELDGRMAGGFNQTFTLKGCVHELGHAMGLPHLGPRVRDSMGNSLMGPRTVVFNKQVPRREDRVYLSEAAAAMLWKHFVFTGTAEGRGELPGVEVRDFRAAFDPRTRQVKVTGRLASDGKAHSVVVTDDAGPNQTDYWRKAYVGRLDGEGNFEVAVTEPTGRAGSFRLMFCFENGALTGDGKTRALKSAFTKDYRFVGRQLRIGP